MSTAQGVGERPRSWAVRVYRLLVRMLPRDFRGTYGAEMAAVHAQRVQEVRSRHGRAVAGLFTLREITTLARMALLQRFFPERAARPRLGGSPGSGFRHDLAAATRQLVKRPRFAGMIIITLALGIGVNTAIFGVVDAVLLRSLPVSEPDRLVAVRGTRINDAGAAMNTFLPLSHENLEDLHERTRSFTGLYAQHGTDMSLSAGQDASRVFGEFVSTSYFDVLGLTPSHGQVFRAGPSGAPGEEPVAVLSHALWRQFFGSDPGVVGSTIRINGQPLNVIGVAPSGFSGTTRTQPVDLWIPVSMFPLLAQPPLNTYFDNRAASMFFAVARLADGVPIDGAAADLSRVSDLLREEYPEINANRGVQVIPLRQASIDPADRPLYVRAGVLLLAVVGILLLIACANIANLLLARTVSRRREVGIRMATGAKRWRISRQFAIESLLLAIAGGVVGLAVAALTTRVLWALRPPSIPQHALDLGLGVRVLAFAFAASVLAGVLFGTVPAYRAGRLQLAGLLAGGGRSATTGRNDRLGRPLLAVQVAICLSALVVAGLFIRSLRTASGIDPGFSTEQLAVISVHPGAQGWDEQAVRDYYRRAEEAVKTMPGVNAASFASVRPFSNTFSRRMYAEGQPEGAEVGFQTQINVVGADYFDVAGVPIVAGRATDRTDRADTRLVAVVNETAAGLVWPEGSALGKRFIWGGDLPPIEVVGVAADAKYSGIGDEAVPYVYLPMAQSLTPSATLLARTGTDATSVLGTLQATLREIAPTLPLAQPATGDGLLRDAQWAPRMGAILTGTFAALALLLVLVGVYGVTSFSVGLRTREVAIRKAVGARPERVMRMVVFDAFRAILLGVAIGVLGALALSRLLSGLLYGVEPGDLPTYVVVVVVLLGIGLLGSYVPARRAATIDCAAALRVD